MNENETAGAGDTGCNGRPTRVPWRHWGCKHTQAGVEYACGWFTTKELEVIPIVVNVGLDRLFNSFKDAVLVRRLDLRAHRRANRCARHGRASPA